MEDGTESNVADARLRVLSQPTSCGSAVSASLKNLFSQYLALVIKNLRLTLRNWKGTIGLLLAPVLVVLFLIIMQQVANLVLKKTDPFPEERLISPVIPACRAHAPANKHHCYSIVYGPSNVPWVTNVMKSVAAASGLDFGSQFLGMGEATLDPEKWLTDRTAMNDWFVANQNTSQLGILFTGPYVNLGAQGDKISNELGYWLFYNQSLSNVLESSILAIEQQLSNQLLSRNNTSTFSANTAKDIAFNRLQRMHALQHPFLQQIYELGVDYSNGADYGDYYSSSRASDPDSINYHAFDSNPGSAKGESPRIHETLLNLLRASNFSFGLGFKEYPVTLLRFAQLSIANQSGGNLYFIPPMIVFFILLTEIVAEKEAKLRVGMKMMGLSNAAYWLSWFTHGLMWILVITIIQFLAGLACGYTFFTKSNAFAVLSLFTTFGIGMMSVAFFLSTVIQSSQTAQTVGYAIILVGFVFQAILNSLNGALVDMLWIRGAAAWIVALRYILSLYPPFNLAKAWSDISSLSSAIPSITDSMIVEGPGFKWADMYKTRVIIDTKNIYVASPPPAESYYTLLLNVLIFFTLTWYLDNVLPGEHGSPRPFYFPFTREYWGFRKKLSSAKRQHKEPSVASPSLNSEEYDSDVEDEQNRANNSSDSASSRWAVRLQNISKFYRKWACCKSDSDTFAVDDVSFTIEKGELFTLLGHNGAGKTTLISMLTGLFKPTSGSATIYGLDLEEDAVRSLIGVCPQHDVLWQELTAREHLMLFARVKGIPSYLIDAEVHDKLRLVGLDGEATANKPAGSFSGGMKRRLSVAVSCIGDPKLIFLDEPSSGLDPVNKRKIWRMIEGLKRDRAIVLTTHSMEEAEVLSDRLAIMAFGKIRAIGDSLHLKNKYGDGYRISMVIDNPHTNTHKLRAASPAPGANGNNGENGISGLDSSDASPVLLRASSPSTHGPSSSSSASKLPSLTGLSPSAIASGMYSDIKKRWPDIHLVSNDSGLLLLGCPKSFQEEMPAFLDFVMADARVMEWGLSHSSLESVFLAVTKKHNFVYEEIDEDEDPDFEKQEEVPIFIPMDPEDDSPAKDDEVDDDPNAPLLSRSNQATTSASASASTIINKNHHTSKKPSLRSHPLRALVRKNLTLQWRQRFSTICQILTPLLIILILALLKVVIKSQLGDAAAPHVFPGLPTPMNSMQNLDIDQTGLSCELFFAYSDMSPRDRPGSLLPNGSGSGFLGYIPQYTCSYHYDDSIPPETQNANFVSFEDDVTLNSTTYSHNVSIRVPYFNAYATEKEIQQQIFSNFTHFNSVPIKQIRGYPYAIQIPDGYVVFKDIDPDHLRLDMTVSVNTNPAVDYHRRNNFTRMLYAPKGYLKSATNMLSRALSFENGYLSLSTMMMRSFSSWTLKQVGVDTTPLMKAFNTIVTQPMPQWSEDNVWAFLELAGTLLYPLGLTLQIPLYLYLLTLEKSEKLREMMLSHGLKTRYYHLVNYLFFSVIYIIAAAVFWIAGIISHSRFFVETHWSVLLLFFIGWGLALVSISCFVSAFLNSPTVATVAGYIIALFGTNLAFLVCVGIYGFTPFSIKTSFPYWTFIWPQFSFSRGMYLLNDACALQGLCYGPITTLQWSDPFAKCLLALYLSAIIYYVLFLYLDAVLPREYGIPKHPLFFLPCWFGTSKPKTTKAPMQVFAQNSSSAPPRRTAVTVDSDASDFDDTEAVVAPLTVSLGSDENGMQNYGEKLTVSEEDVNAELNRVVSQGYHPDSPLVCEGLRKVYDSGKVAVKGLYLAVDRNECFGLLGENGAGKSTTLSMLTGMFSPSDGTAFVGGYDIRTEIDQVHLSMGLCPQFDLLWSDLTVREHLLFYARLKGVGSSHEDEHVDKLISEVGLTKAANKQADALSGGMRRRLSIAISLVGDSKIVFLDEPTTGLDAASRRQIWSIIRRAKKGRAIVLTTHSMDEAELLCNRIGILAHGKLRCLGNQQHLKSLFGEGVRLKINYAQTAPHHHQHANNGSSSSKNDMNLPESPVTLDAPASSAPAVADSVARGHVINFIQQQFPSATIAGDFHGTIEFLLGNSIPISTIFRVMESQSPKDIISDWAVSQIGLEDVFQTVVAQAENDPESHADVSQAKPIDSSDSV